MTIQSRHSLGDVLDSMTAPGVLVETVDAEAKTVRCHACAHRCLIREGRRGICQVRFNRDGVLYVPRGYVASLQADPIEKKPFFHVLPGSDALSFGMLGCDFRCDFCQNWLTSQTLRDDNAGITPQAVSADRLVDLARLHRVTAIASTYNEPLITTEWAVEVFKLAKRAGLRTLVISNGNATPEALEYFAPHLDAYKIDLKTMRDATYRKIIGGVLQHVLDSIQRVHDLGIWLEIVTLIIPGMNDSSEELWDAARYIRSVSPDIPWHVTGFYPTYKMTDRGSTPADTLTRAAEIGMEAGLNYVYAGNRPGHTGDWEDTRCPACQTTLIRRQGFRVLHNRVTPEGTCPNCGAAIPGVWR
ncbi:MAG TPA: AmmeMemoRadiSam system radical SAM enzyme [Aggregatilineales bacterium]|nr:AmmeMemoRadiSam system radical SAM enzyme [Aggregatilineales bacterium]